MGSLTGPAKWAWACIRTPKLVPLTPLLLFTGPVALEMYTALTDIQTEKAADPAGWVVPVC